MGVLENLQAKESAAIATGQPQATPEAIGMGTAKEARARASSGLTNAIPYVGGMVGGLAGNVPGAIIGGMVGKDIQSGIEGKGLPTAGEAIGEGVKQGVFEGVGRGVGAAAAPLARGIMRVAAKVSPEAAEVAVREGITATQKGLRKLNGRITDQARNTWRLIRSYEGRGIKFDQGQLATDVMGDIHSQLAGHAIGQPELEAAAKLTEQFLHEHPGPITPSALQMIKQTSDDIAGPIYKAMQRAKEGGQPLAADQIIRYRWHKALADRARQSLEAIDTRINPETGMMESPARMANAETAKLISLRNELFPEVKGAEGIGARIARRGAGPAVGAAIGASREGSPGQRATHGLEGALLGAVMTSPQVLTSIAINMPWLLPLIGQTPRAAGAVIESSQ